MQNKHSQVLSTTTAVRKVMQMAHNINLEPESDVVISKILAVSRRARQRQNEGGPQVTGCLAAADAHVIKQGTNWLDISEIDLRTVVIFAIRRLTAGRPEDPTKIYRGVWRFEPPESYFDTCDRWFYRLHLNKDQRGARMNTYTKRSKFEQQAGEWSTEVSIKRNRTQAHQVDYLKAIGVYLERTRDRPVPWVHVKNPYDASCEQAQPLLVGADTQAHRNKSIGTQRCSSVTLNFLERSGAFAPPLKAEHVRHSALSTVYHWYGNMPERKHIWDEMLARARHDMATFLNSYHLRVDDRTRQALESVPSSASLEDVLMSGVPVAAQSKEGIV